MPDLQSGLEGDQVMATLPVNIPIKRLVVGQYCEDCNTDNLLEVHVYSLNVDSVNSVAVLRGCTECKSGLCREDS